MNKIKNTPNLNKKSEHGNRLLWLKNTFLQNLKKVHPVLWKISKEKHEIYLFVVVVPVVLFFWYSNKTLNGFVLCVYTVAAAADVVGAIGAAVALLRRGLSVVAGVCDLGSGQSDAY